MGQHTHDFVEPEKYIFEDVLVAEMLRCEEEFCDAVQPIQYEVDFTSFKRNGEPVSESEAESLWDNICEDYGAEVEIAGEKWTSDGVEIENRSGTVFTFTYDGSMSAVETTVNGDTVQFDVEFYRKLSVKD